MYRRLLVENRVRVERERRRHLWLGYGKLADFLVGTIAAGVLVHTHGPFSLLLIPLAIFIVLIVVHDRVLEKLDVNAGRVNAMTSGNLPLVRTPLHFPSDRECFECVASTVGKFNRDEVTVAWIHNTMELGTLALSENLSDQIANNPMLSVAGPRFEMEFDTAGNLGDLPCA